MGLCGSSQRRAAPRRWRLCCAAAGVAADSRPAPAGRVPLHTAALVLDGGRVQPVASPRRRAGQRRRASGAGAAAQAGLTFPQALAALGAAGELSGAAAPPTARPGSPRASPTSA